MSAHLICEKIVDKIHLAEIYKQHYSKNSKGHFFFFGFLFLCRRRFSREERAGKEDASSEAGRLAWSAVEAAAVVAHLQKTELHQKRAQTPSPICVEGAQVMTAAQKRSSSTSCHMSPTWMLALSLLLQTHSSYDYNWDWDCGKQLQNYKNDLQQKCVFHDIWDFLWWHGRTWKEYIFGKDTYPPDSCWHRSLIKTYVQRKYNIPATRYLTLTSTYQFPIYRTRNLGDPPGPNLYLVLGSMPSPLYSHTVFVR